MSQLKLTDVAKINMGQSPSSETYNSEKNGLPFYQGNVDFGEKYPTVRIWCDKPTKIAEPGDILMSVRAPIGALNYANEKCCIGRGLAAITPDPDMTSSEFIYWFLRARHSELNRIGTGSTFKAINRKTLESIEFPKYNKNEQYYIAEILSKIDKTIGEKKAQLEKLDNLIKARFVEMFGDNFGEIVELGNVCDVRDGTHDSPKYHNEGYPLVTSKNICNGKIDFSTCNLIQKEDYDKINKRSKVEIGDILMPMIGTVGNPIIINTNNEFAIKNVALIKFKDNSVILNTFVKALLESDYFGRAVLSKTKGGTQKFISLGDIRKLELNLPPIELQNQFAAFVAQVDKSKFALQNNIISLMNLWYNINQYVCERTYGEA